MAIDFERDTQRKTSFIFIRFSHRNNIVYQRNKNQNGYYLRISTIDIYSRLRLSKHVREAKKRASFDCEYMW